LLRLKFPNQEEDFKLSVVLQPRLHLVLQPRPHLVLQHRLHLVLLHPHLEPLLPHLGLQRLLLEQQPILLLQGHLLSLSPHLFTRATLTLLSNTVLGTIKFTTQDHSGAAVVSAVRSEEESEVLSL